MSSTDVPTQAPEYYCPACGTRYQGPGICTNNHPPTELLHDPNTNANTEGETVSVTPPDNAQPVNTDPVQTTETPVPAPEPTPEPAPLIPTDVPAPNPTNQDPQAAATVKQSQLAALVAEGKVWFQKVVDFVGQ